MTVQLTAGLSLLAAWLIWPHVIGPLWRARRITPGTTTVLLIARPPTILGLGALVAGAPPLVVLFVVAASTAAGMLLFRYFREFMSDPRIT